MRRRACCCSAPSFSALSRGGRVGQAAARERELAKEREKESKPKERSVAYNREQSRPSGNASTDVPAYNKPSVAKPE